MKKNKFLLFIIVITLLFFSARHLMSEAGDELRMKLSITPVVRIEGGAEYDTTYVIHSGIGREGASFVDTLSTNYVWWQNDSVYVNATADSLFFPDSVSGVKYQDGTDLGATDKLVWLFVENMATNSDDQIWLTFDESTPSNDGDLSVKPGSFIFIGSDISNKLHEVIAKGYGDGIRCRVIAVTQAP